MKVNLSLYAFIFTVLMYLSFGSPTAALGEDVSADRFSEAVENWKRRNQTQKFPILDAAGEAVTRKYDCPPTQDLTDLVEEREATGDDHRIISCLHQFAAELGFEGMREWIAGSNYERVAYILPPSSNNPIISIQAKNPPSWFWWLPFHPTPYATISISWTTSGELRRVSLNYTRI